MKPLFKPVGLVCSLAMLTYSAISCGGGASDAATSATTNSNSPAGTTSLPVSSAQSICQLDWQPANKLGVNLGSQTHWGAEQLLSNVLPNPGLEPYVDAGLLRVDQAQGQTLYSNDTWLGRADHQWAGATATVMTGKLVGQSFEVADNLANDSGKASITLASTNTAAIQDLQGQLIAVRTRQLNPLAPLDLQPAKWTTQGQATLNFGSAIDAVGQTVVKLSPLAAPAGIVTWLDAISERAGTLLPIDNDWVMAVYTKATGPVSLTAQVGRAGVSNPSLKNLNISTGNLPWTWQKNVWSVKPDNINAKGTLEVRLTATGSGTLEIDNLYLGPREGLDDFINGKASKQAFRTEVGTALGTLGAAFLRDWQGQLGDSPTNRFAVRAARAPHKYRREHTDLFDGYSIPELLAQAKAIGATPWIVMPTTWSPTESAEFAHLMANALAQAGTSDWLLEYGNENWNTVFQPAGYTNLTQHMQAANRARQAFDSAWKQSATEGQKAPQWLNNLQFFNAPAQAETLNGFTAPAGLSLSAYSTVRLNSDAVFPAALFDTGHLGRWQKWRTYSSATQRPNFVPEVNLHPLAGTLDGATKTKWLNDPVSAVAVAHNLLTGWSQGASTQLLYSLAGFDATDQQSQLVSLFGLYDRLTDNATLRPSGLAMKWLNQWLPANGAKVVLLSNASERAAGLWRFGATSATATGCSMQAMALLNLSDQARSQNTAPMLAGTSGKWALRTVGLNNAATEQQTNPAEQITLPAWSMTLINAQ